MARNSAFDPIVVEPVLTPEKVRELVLRGRESAKLDYKEAYDPADRRSVVRLAKHVLAMANTSGGYLVIGVDDDAIVKGLSLTQIEAIDEATIRGQINSFCDVPIPLFVQNRVSYEDATLAIVTVLPLQHRVAVAKRDGTMPAVGEQPLFRAGDVLVRHGSASERWIQDDADWISERIVKTQREQWLNEFVGDFKTLQRLASQLPSAPEVDSSAFDRSPEDFQALVVGLLRGSNG